MQKKLNKTKKMRGGASYPVYVLNAYADQGSTQQLGQPVGSATSLAQATEVFPQYQGYKSYFAKQENGMFKINSGILSTFSSANMIILAPSSGKDDNGIGSLFGMGQQPNASQPTTAQPGIMSQLGMIGQPTTTQPGMMGQPTTPQPGMMGQGNAYGGKRRRSSKKSKQSGGKNKKRVRRGKKTNKKRK